MKRKEEFLYTLKARRLEMLTEGPDADEEKGLQRHAAYLRQLAAEDTVLLFGRTRNRDESTFGLVVLQADSEAQAEEIMNNDPAVAGGLMTGKLFPYRIAGMKGREDEDETEHGAEEAACVACGRNGDIVPLLTFRFQGRERRICPQHLPVLIHDPTQLVGFLPGAEDLQPADHHD